MAKFRCKRSGNIVSFIIEDDIAQMRVHEGYEEVIDEIVKEDANEENANEAKENANEKRQVLRKPGRPKRK